MNKITVNCSTGKQETIELTQEEIQALQPTQEQLNQQEIQSIKKELLELDKEVSRIDEDILTHLSYTPYQSKQDVISKKLELRQRLTTLTQ